MSSNNRLNFTLNTNDKERTDIAENHQRLEDFNDRLRNLADNSGGVSHKRNATNSDDDNGEQWTTVKEHNRREKNRGGRSNTLFEDAVHSPSKKQRTGHVQRQIFRRGGNFNQRGQIPSEENRTQTSAVQMDTDEQGGDAQPERFEVTSQALAYAVDTHLPPIKIECEPGISTKDSGKRFAMAFIKEIEQDFRRLHPIHRRAIGFDHWWIDSRGHFNGLTNDVDLFVYLCAEKRYPTELEKIRLKPIPPKRLPPQNTVIIKFVSKEIEISELEDELRQRYSSIYTVEQMLGTMRSNSRHVRVDLCDRKDYDSILNAGKFGVAGKLFDVDEYLATPKILICSYCNRPGHTKKNCIGQYEVCRRCGGDRADGHDHQTCLIRCHHCGGDHLAVSHQCPTMIAFRRDIVEKLKQAPDKLPAHVQLFIPVDCRPYGNRQRVLANREAEKFDSMQPPINPWTNRSKTWFPSSLPSATTTMETEIGLESTLKDLSNELQHLKTSFDNEREKIKDNCEKQIQMVRDGWLIMQQQIQLQNQRIESITKTIADACIQISTSVFGAVSVLCEIAKKTVDNNERIQIEQMSKQVSLNIEQLHSLVSVFAHHQQQLNSLEQKQTIAFGAAVDSLFTSYNGL